MRRVGSRRRVGETVAAPSRERRSCVEARRPVADLSAAGGFPLEAITIPVRIWHGARDGLVPIAAAHRLVSLMPDARLEVIPDGGHYVIYDLIDQLLETLRHDAHDERRPGMMHG